MEFTTDSIFQALKSPLAVVDSPERRTQLEDYSRRMQQKHR